MDKITYRELFKIMMGLLAKIEQSETITDPQIEEAWRIYFDLLLLCESMTRTNQQLPARLSLAKGE